MLLKETDLHLARIRRGRCKPEAEGKRLARAEDRAGRPHRPGLDLVLGVIVHGKAQLRNLHRPLGDIDDGAFHHQDPDALMLRAEHADIFEGKAPRRFTGSPTAA